MATDNLKNLVSSNEKYASTFDKGDLALPPAKKYLVGEDIGRNTSTGHD
jgi:carbonic anhydrase